MDELAKLIEYLKSITHPEQWKYREYTIAHMEGERLTKYVIDEINMTEHLNARRRQWGEALRGGIPQ